MDGREVMASSRSPMFPVLTRSRWVVENSNIVASQTRWMDTYISIIQTTPNRVEAFKSIDLSRPWDPLMRYGPLHLVRTESESQQVLTLVLGCHLILLSRPGCVC